MRKREKERGVKNKVKKRRIILKIILFVLIIYLVVLFYNVLKPLPEGTSVEGTIYNIADEDIDFLYDLNYLENNNSQIIEQEIFNNVFYMIDNAQRLIVIDVFLFNSDYSSKGRLINLTRIMKDKLIEKKKTNPNIEIYFTTDEINNFYGSYTSEEILELQENNITVIITDLTKLRDSNPTYSAFWRIFLMPLGTYGEGSLRHPLGREDKEVTLRAYLKLINTKANHRKIIVADNGNEIWSIITSANPHEASSLHSNIAFLIKKDIWKDLIESEKGIAKFSGTKINEINTNFAIYNENSQEKDISVQLLTEGKIRDNLIRDIDSTVEGESINIAMFYLSDRKIIDSIKKASERGVEIRLILDPNKDAFAREKNGIPNRQVALELIEDSNNQISVRWYNTQGEQFHTKLIIIKKKDKIIVYGGSANLTKRNVGNLNLETDVKITSQYNKDIAIEIIAYFENLWENKNGKYTLDFDSYKDESTSKYWIYRFQEFSGFSSF